MKPRLLILLPLVVAAVFLGFRAVRRAAPGDTGVIRVSGNIEVTDTQVSFRIPGLVVRRLVSEGESVTNGQVVARLDETELAQEAAMRRAEAAAAEAVLAELEAGTRPEEIAQAAAALEGARTEARRLKSEYVRQQELFGEEVIAPREYEAAQAGAEAAAARTREAEARLTLLENGPRAETIRAARSRLEQAQHALALAETRLGYAVLRAPLAGVVLAEGVEEGEYVMPGTPVVTIGDLDNAWLRAYLNETDLGRVAIGQPVQVTTDTYPDKVYEGRLSFLASEAEFTPKNVQTAKERVKLVYRIKVDIPNPDQELKPGMPADADIIAR
jgi:HlyD family secretion protein